MLHLSHTLTDGHTTIKIPAILHKVTNGARVARPIEARSIGGRQCRVMGTGGGARIVGLHNKNQEMIIRIPGPAKTVRDQSAGL